MEYGRKNSKEKVSKVLASERMNRKEDRKEYERKVCERLRELRMTVEEGESVSEVLRMFKGAITTVAVEVVGYKALRSQMDR